MLLYPNCKINIGLRIVARRPDGYHDIETVMYPVTGLCDALELNPSSEWEFVATGLSIGGDPAHNICCKARDLVRREFPDLHPTRIHLHKMIPMGAGLGGGSADGAFVIRGLNDLYALGMDTRHMEALAAETGSDVPFFINNTAALATRRGEILTPCAPSLAGLWLVIVKPDVAIGTAEAYAGVTPHAPHQPLTELLAHPLSTWRTEVSNDFEPSVFSRIPLLAELKHRLYSMGALYTSMSGSGSSIYALFEDKADDLNCFEQYFVHQEFIG